MRSLLKLVLLDDVSPQGFHHGEERRRRVRIEDYLDHLCAPLVGVVPYEERLALRTETEEHLYALCEDREGEDGLSPTEATETALREYGEPWRLGQQFADTYCRTQRENPAASVSLFRSFTPGVLRAFACFGPASVVTVLTAQYTALTPVQRETGFLWLVVLHFLSPLVAGTLTGFLVPLRAVRAASAALGIILLHSGIVALLMWPQRDGFSVLATQVLWWLPMGTLSAGLASVAARHLRRTLFLRGWASR